MSLEGLRSDIHEALRVDLTRARRLVASYARRAARSKDPLVSAIALFERAQVDHLEGRHRQAVAGYSSARRTFARLGAQSHLLATEIGAIQVQANLGVGTAVRRGARRLRRLASGPQQTAAAEIAIGSALDSLGDERAAEACFQRAIEGLRGRRKPTAAFMRATARHNLGLRLARRGAVAAALRHLDTALAFYRRHPLAEVVRHNRGWAQGVAGQAVEALRDLKEARQAFRERGDLRRAALAELDEAELMLRLGDHDAARTQARRAARTLRMRQSPLEAARAQLLAARADMAAGRRASGRRQATRARELFGRAGDTAGAAMAAVVIGTDLARAETALLRTGHWMGALDALVARARALPAGAGARLLSRRLRRYPPVLRRWLLPDLYHLQAKGDEIRRIPLLRRAYRAAEELRRRAPTGSLRATSLASHLSIYEELARALLDRGRAPDRREAFVILDAARARTLREEMEREAPGLLDRPKLRRLRERLEALWRSLEWRDAEPGPLRSLETELLRDVARCEKEFVRAMVEAEGTTAAGDAGARLPLAPCLAYAVVGGEVVGLLTKGREVVSWSCGPLAVVRRDLEAFLFQVARRLHGASDTESADACLARLSARLLGGAPTDLGTEALRVVVPPELGSVPVEALALGDRPLVETAAITYAPFACLSASPWPRDGAALVVGIGSEQLPEVRREVAYLRRRLPAAEVLEGRAATRAAILDALSGTRLVHLAGHAQAREDLPHLSSLKVVDGWICAADLRASPVRRSLVVLSACRTGDPSLRWNGEAMGGFPRCLLAAGAAGVVASRWEIPDKTAAEWMRHIYDNLEGLPPEQAVAQAGRAMRLAHPHPADWAAFLLIRGGRLWE